MNRARYALPRVPDALRHGAKRSDAVLVRDRPKGGGRGDPGSAAHHFMLRCARDTGLSGPTGLGLKRILKVLWLASAASFAIVSLGAAAEIGPCDNVDRVSYLVGQTKSYANGKIRVAHVDTDGEPVCCSSHLLIIIPAQELGSQCFALSQKAASKADGSALGFSNIAFNKITGSYDPKRGLMLTVPYTLYNPDGGKGKPSSARVRVDLRGEGSVKIEP